MFIQLELHFLASLHLGGTTQLVIASGAQVESMWSFKSVCAFSILFAELLAKCRGFQSSSAGQSQKMRETWISESHYSKGLSGPLDTSIRLFQEWEINFTVSSHWDNLGLFVIVASVTMQISTNEN